MQRSNSDSSGAKVGKSLGCLVRETELCARILQHHWRGVFFERSLHRREYDPSVRARIRSMHLIKFVELRHQFKAYRETVGYGGLPANAVEAYVTIVHQMVQTQSNDFGEPCIHGRAPASPIKTPTFVLANQRKVINSGSLAFLASLITATQRPQLTTMVISTVREIAYGQGPEKVVDILQSNIVERAVSEMTRIIDSVSKGNCEKSDQDRMDTTLDLIYVLCSQALAGSRQFSNSSNKPFPFETTPSSNSSEKEFLQELLNRSATKFLINDTVLTSLFQVLQVNASAQHHQESRCKKILTTVRLMACCPFGFPHVLSILTQNGGRFMELVLDCFRDSRRAMAGPALSLFCEMTDHPHGRQGLTTAGAVRSFLRWSFANLDRDDEREPFVMAIIGCALLARQTPQTCKPDLAWLLTSIETSRGRLEAAHKLLLNLVMNDDNEEGAGYHFAEKAGILFHSTGALPVLLKFLIQVTPTCMEPSFQTRHHRNISCIVLSRFFRVPEIVRACFSEDTINHLALSIQCNRLDEAERAVARYSVKARLIHRLGSKEACKALTYLARCFAGERNTTGVGDGVFVARLRPSVTSSFVPELPQAMVCDVMFRLHVIEDLIGYIVPVDFSADSPDVETALTDAAVELAGHLRPLPYGEAARNRFFKTFGAHDHGKYAAEKVMLLVELVAPSIIHVLREPNLQTELVEACCKALSRIACTKTACSELLVQGCLQIALMHLPEFLLETGSLRKSGKATEIIVDSMTDEHGLLGVPPSLYTLLAKLCAVAEGRMALLRAQVLPRILKRLHLKDSSAPSKDVACKCEIAVLLSRLAMVNTTEGNTGELFIHFGVVDALVKLLRTHNPMKTVSSQRVNTIERPCNNSKSVQRDKPHSSHSERKKQLRVVNHLMAGIAALSQDILKCVPKLVALGILKLLYPLLDLSLPGMSTEERSVRADTIQLYCMQVIHSIAVYPFGEYHLHLLRAGTGDSRMQRFNSHDVVAERKTFADAPTITLMDKVRRIGFDFAAELRSRGVVPTVDGKTVGDLARETLSAVNERSIFNQRKEYHSQPELSMQSSPSCISSPHINKLPVSNYSKSESDFHQQRSPSGASTALSAFPTLSPQSPQCLPLSHCNNSERKGCNRVQEEESVALEPESAAKFSRPLSPVVKIHSTLPVTINGVDLSSTRPPGKQDLTLPMQKSQSSPRYIFTTPKPKKRVSAPNAATSCLMLDPLFDSAASSQDPQNSDHEKRRDRSHHDKRDVERILDTNDETQACAFSQENDRFGHYVQVKGRRARRGDIFMPSLGLIDYDSAPVSIQYNTKS